jgi:hypothetical protein
MGSGRLANILQRLNWDLSASRGLSVPSSFAELCRRVDRVEGLDLAVLVAQLPPHQGGGDGALAEVLHRAKTLFTDQILEKAPAIVSAVVAAAQGDQDAIALVESLLAEWADDPKAGTSVSVVRLLLAGERDLERLTADLDPRADAYPYALVQAIVDILAGRVELTLPSWREPETPESAVSPEGAMPEVGEVEAAAPRDPWAFAGVAPGPEKPAGSPTMLPSASKDKDARAAQDQPVRGQKFGRNQPCWCGSGKKYKRCHGSSRRSTS